MSLKNVFLLFVFLCIANACKTDKHNEQVIYTNVSKSMDSEIWKQDFCGCLGIRTPEMAKKIIKENDLVNKSINEFEKYFGVPDNMKTSNGVTIMKYYFNSTCDSNNRLKDTDKSWIEFVFENGRLREVPDGFCIE